MFCVISESSVGTGAGCFPAGSTVYTETGPRDIETVQKGDMVLAADDTGKLVYSEVIIILFQIIRIYYLEYNIHGGRNPLVKMKYH